MYNWSIDTKRLKKNKKKYEIWKLEQMINFGFKNKKISEKKLKKYFNFLNIDSDKKNFLNLILYGKKPSFD